jgi:hypothetical protein
MNDIELEKEYTYKQWTWHVEKSICDRWGEADLFIGGRCLSTINKNATKKDVEFRIQTALDELKDLADVFQIKIEEF